MVWKIERGSASARQHKAVQSVFAGYDMDAVFESILKGARGFGYGPMEAIWAQKDGLTSPVDLVGKPQRWFVFSQTNELRFRSRDHLMDGEELPAMKFLCPTNEASYDNPYGLGLNSRCFWPVVFKRGGWRFWISFSEKYGQVWPVGKLPRAATLKEQSDLLDILVRMVADGAAVIPDDSSVDFKESASKGATSDLYRGIIAEANSAISTVWHGHAGAGESTTGKLGNDTTAIVVRDDLRDDDANLITRTMQQVINWMCEVNWGSSADAPQFVLKAREKIDTTQSERDDKLSACMLRSGLMLTGQYYRDTYGLAPEHIGTAPAAPEPSPAPKGPTDGVNPLLPGEKEFSDGSNPYPDQSALDAAISAVDPKDMQKRMEAVLRPVIDGLQKTGNVDAAMDSLLAAYPRMDTSGLQELLARAIFVADCWGRLNA